MKPQAAIAAVTALTIALAATVAPAFAARSSYVVDDAQMLSPAAVSQLNQQIGDFNAQTGKEVVVVTTPSLNGESPQSAAEKAFAQQQVNGVMLFFAKAEKQDGIVPDKAASRFFPAGSLQTIRNAMRPSLRQGNYDEGIETGVGLIINTYRSHLSSLNATRNRQPVYATPRNQQSSGGFSMSWIWWIIILAVIFFVIRGIFRAMAGPRMYGPGPGYGGPGYGPGYGGPGYGYGGGGGGFWSGLLGGLGGAWLGNELFGGNRNIGGGGDFAGTAGGVDPGTASDAGGWQSDAGQADMGNASFGGWDSGGGDSGGGLGGGDSGGGWGGGDSGGGGGDSGGGW
ncbi:MAG TPA: TPM domain-containing protein [Candidatus Elarobacter sp.]|jgi:uncharacterized protein|nr:TPM domain-containing protein [Candidatus Elarobacter sp.]